MDPISDTTDAAKASRRDLLKWFGAGAAVSMVPFGLGDWSTAWLQVERRTIRVPRWSANGIRVAFLADFHAMDRRRLELSERAIDLALAEKPDLVLLGGDFINSVDRFRVEAIVRIVNRFEKAKCPVAAVYGNHDYWTRRIPRLTSIFNESPVKILRNEAFEMDGMVVGGVDDGLAEKQDPAFLQRYEGRDSVLAVYHEPDFVDQLPANVSLMLAGHSHGGQICLPGGMPIHTPKGAHRYIAGYYRKAHVPLYVTRGIGTVGIDCRLFCRPEISMLTIERES